MSKTLMQALLRAQTGTVQTFENLSIIPLLDTQEEGIAYLAMREAFEQDGVEVEEISEGGSVPNLKVKNKTTLPVLLVDGEELQGAKQNRIVNTSLLIDAKSEQVIPVSCTERGRWQYTSRKFSDSGVMMSAKARYQKSMRVKENLFSKAAYDAEQYMVWDDVEKLHAKRYTRSRTRAMRDAFEQDKDKLETFANAFAVQPDQKGMIVFINGHLFAIDYVARNSVYKHLHEKWIKSHAIEAIGLPPESGNPVDMNLEAKRFLQKIAETEPVFTHKPVGLGEDFRYDDETWGGACLIHRDTPVHFTAFNKQMPGDEEEQNDADQTRSNHQQILEQIEARREHQKRKLEELRRMATQRTTEQSNPTD